MARILGAVEAGGTKFQCALATDAMDLLISQRIPTTSPRETWDAVTDFFEHAQGRHGIASAFGVGSFGPLDLDRTSLTYGQILPTPKAGWTGADLLGPLRRGFGKPIGLDTDVNAAAMAELKFGGHGLNSLCYVTVGTGVGGGVVIDGRPLHGMLHPEMGHMNVRRDPRDTLFAGICPFHGDCLEGLVCGPAIQARWGASIDQIPTGLEAPSIVGGYLGQLVANVALMMSCQRVVFGGGVMTSGCVLPHVRSSAQSLLNGYLPTPQLRRGLEDYVTAPSLGERSGIVGAIGLALLCAGA